MRKGIFVVFLLVAIVAIVTVPAGAKDEKVTTSQGQPFLEIWNAIKDLQNKLDKIQLIPGPVGPQGIQGPKGDTGTCTCAVSLEEFNALKARVAALEGGDECYPVPETCNGIDDNCDGTPDNGATCGEGQECLNGRCVSDPSHSECTSWLDCAAACNSPGSCTFTCMGSPRGETQQDFMSLMDCGSGSCGDIGGGTPFINCLAEQCTDEFVACTGPIECTPDCTGKVCGSDGCGGSCGECNGGKVCDMNGQCITNPCDSNPCTTPGEPICGDDEASIITPYGEGQCSYYDGVTHCSSYPYRITQCGTGKVCENAQCIAGGDSGDPCVPNPCTTPPDPECISQGGVYVVITYGADGECIPRSEFNYDCNYPSTVTIECSVGQSCDDGQCIGP